MIITTKNLLLVTVLIGGILGMIPRVSEAQEPFDPSIHWAYASTFGTGWYKINDQRKAFVLRTGPRWKVGEAGFDEQGKRTIAYSFQVPLTLGFAKLDFDDISGIIDSENLATGSVNFAMDVDIPLTRNFFIRPHAEVGYATVLDDSESAWTYRAELKSRYKIQSGKLDWSLIFDVGLVGYEANDNSSDDFTFAAVGAEFEYPVNWLSSKDSQTMLYWTGSYVDFIDEIEFETGIDRIDSIGNYWQVGAAIGKRNKPIKIWFLNFDRLGLAYNFSTTGDLRGVKFVFRSLYEF